MTGFVDSLRIAWDPTPGAILFWDSMLLCCDLRLGPNPQCMFVHVPLKLCSQMFQHASSLVAPELACCARHTSLHALHYRVLASRKINGGGGISWQSTMIKHNDEQKYLVSPQHSMFTLDLLPCGQYKGALRGRPIIEAGCHALLTRTLHYITLLVHVISRGFALLCSSLVYLSVRVCAAFTAWIALASIPGRTSSKSGPDIDCLRMR